MINDKLEQDEFGTVISSVHTINGIAEILNKNCAIVFAWTDGEGTQLDILMVLQPIQAGELQRGMSAHTDLFVAVSGYGMFGFDINNSGTYPSYVAEKLGMNNDVTVKKLTDLINDVRMVL